MKKEDKVFSREIAREHFGRIAVFILLFLFFTLILSLTKQSFFGQVNSEKHIYFEIILLLLLGVLAEAAVYYFKMQNVIVLMLLGVLISPSFLNLSWVFFHSINLTASTNPPEIFHHPEIINVFAQLGAIILLFKVGLHSKIEKVFSKDNLLVALAGVIVPFVIGYIYATQTGGQFAYSMFIGAALAATSVGVTVAILKELGVMHKRFAEIIIGAAILDDILGLLILSFVTNIVDGSGTGSIIITFVTAAIFITGALLAGNYFIKYLDKDVLGRKRTMASLAFMLSLAYFAELINLSAIVGAFLAGLILNRSKHYENLEEKTTALEFLFMPIFFISLGLLVDIKAIMLFFIPILIITAIAFFTKMIGCGAVAIGLKMNFAESLLVGIGMVPRGEVALIIAAIGLTKNILTAQQYSIISAMALLTTLMVPTLISHIVKTNSARMS
ncbi:MAG: cation:proton antiporter [archaeon]